MVIRFEMEIRVNAPALVALISFLRIVFS